MIWPCKVLFQFYQICNFDVVSVVAGHQNKDWQLNTLAEITINPQVTVFTVFQHGVVCGLFRSVGLSQVQVIIEVVAVVCINFNCIVHLLLKSCTIVAGDGLFGCPVNDGWELL